VTSPASFSTRRAAIVLGYFITMTLLLGYPLSLEPNTRVLDLGADTRLFLWTLSWDVHALVTEPLRLFQANIFFPEPDTLAYSEHLLGSALLGAPWLLATGNPVLALNAVLLISCVGSGAGMYFLARRLGVGVAGALAAGTIFAFAPPRFFRLGQLHLATVLWMPFCLGFLHQYASGGARRHLITAAVLFTLQALSGGQTGLFLLMASTGLLVYLSVFGRLRPRGKIMRDLAIAFGLVVILNLPFLLPYLRVQQEAGLRRSLEEAREWSPAAASFLAAPTHAQRALLSSVPGLERRVRKSANAYLFPGFLTLILASLALRRSDRTNASRPAATAALPQSRPPGWLVTLDAAVVLAGLALLLIQATGGVRWQLGSLTLSARGVGRAALVLLLLVCLRFALARRRSFSFLAPSRRLVSWLGMQLGSRMGVQIGFYLLLAVLTFWISLGPRFGLYAALYRLLPGFDFIRVPSRFTLLTLLGVSVLAGVGLERWLAGVRASRRWLVATIAMAVLIAEFAAFPLDARPYPRSIPPIDQWVARQAQEGGGFAVVELPVPDPRDAARSARRHSLYMWHSTAHWQGLVNGYSGFTPPGHDALFRKLVNFPDEASLDALETLGVRYVVVHLDGYSDEEWERVEEKLGVYGDRLRLDATEGQGLAYYLTHSEASQPGHGS
jgi:hypothetical protein